MVAELFWMPSQGGDEQLQISPIHDGARTTPHFEHDYRTQSSSQKADHLKGY
jgi:hypothetical protein